MENNLEIVPQFGEAEMKTMEEKIWNMEVDPEVVPVLLQKEDILICKESNVSFTLLFLKNFIDILQKINRDELD